MSRRRSSEPPLIASVQTAFRLVFHTFADDSTDDIQVIYVINVQSLEGAISLATLHLGDTASLLEARNARLPNKHFIKIDNGSLIILCPDRKDVKP